MAAVPATGAPPARVGDVADATSSGRTFWRDAELEVIAELECRRRGVRRIQRNRLLNVRRTGAVLRKRDAAGGNGTASTVQLARDLYADVGDAWDAGNYPVAYKLAIAKQNSIRRWLRVLADLGVIEYEGLQGKGFRWRFASVPQDVATMASARARSSVGWSVGDVPHEGRRRRQVAAQTLPQRRVRRWCPRAGRGAMYEPPRGPFFSAPEFGGPGVPPLKGRNNQKQQTRAHEAQQPGVPAAAMRAPGDRPDALERACPVDQRAALSALRALGGEEGGLRRAGEAGAPWTALALALWERSVPFEPRLSREASGQLERSMAQLERLWGRPSAVDELAVHIEGLAPHGFDRHGGEEIRSLRWVVLILKQQGRQARRHARRAPAPRPWKARGRA